MHKKRNGFSAIEIVLVVVVIAALAVGGWWAWHKRSNSTKTYTSSRPSDEKWLIHTTNYEKLKISYPNSFSLRDYSGKNASAGDGELAQDSIVLQNMTDYFKIFITTGVDEYGEICDSCKVLHSEYVTILNKQYLLNYIQSTDVGSGVSHLVIGANAQDWSGTKIPGKNIVSAGTTLPIIIQASFYDDQASKSLPTLSQALKDKHVMDFKKILNRLDY